MSPQIQRKIASLALITLTIALLSAPSRAGENTWTSVGPYGGAIAQLYFDPVDPKIAYARTIQVLYKSMDGGKTWSEVDFDAGGSPITGIAIDPARSKRLYVASFGGLFRSDDAGVTFQKLAGVPGNPRDRMLLDSGPLAVSVSPSGKMIHVTTTKGPPST